MLLRIAITLSAATMLAACYPPAYRQSEVAYESPGVVYAEPGYQGNRSAYGNRRPSRDYGASNDRAIHDRVHAALRRDHYIRESGIQVHVHLGAVTLTGYVRDRHEARRAHDIAHQVRGVHRVLNKLTAL